MTLVQRRIDLKFVLGEQSFGSGGEDTLTLEGLRCSANISRAGLVSLASLELRVWGMTLDSMNKLSVTNQVAYPNQRNNIVTVLAGDEGNPLTEVFSGNMSLATINARGAPDVTFDVSAASSIIDTVKPADPTSYEGSVSIDVVLSAIAKQMTPPRNYQNNGVTMTHVSPYWPGTLMDQIHKVCDAADCMYVIDDRTISIWPKGGSLGASGLALSRDNGLVGYPEFSDNVMSFTSLFNPLLEYGKTVQIKSDIVNANHDWIIASVSHNLDARLPGGQWFSRCDCGILGQALPSV